MKPGVTIIVRDSTEGEADVTEAVQALYDMVVQSMDWGSGFFTVEDIVPVALLAKLCEFGEVDEINRYLERFWRQAQLSEETMATLRKLLGEEW